MSEETESEIQEGEAGPAKKKMSGKKIVLLFVLPILLLGGGAAGVMMSGLLDSPKQTAEEGHGASAPKDKSAGAGHVEPVKAAVFYDLPELLVNLNSTSRRPSFLKIRVSLELRRSGDISRVDQLKPRIIDNFQVYLRELRMDDLRGSAGIYRLREELLARVNTAVHPIQVDRVLFKEVLVQ